MYINNIKIAPKGWSLKRIGDLLDFERPDNYIVESNRYDPKNKIPVLTANKSFVLGHTDEDFGVYKNTPVIIFDDFTADSKFVDFPFKIKSSAIKILKTKDQGTDLRFVYELMKFINFKVANHKRHYISQYQYLKVAIPPINEQKKIADILFAVDKEIKKNKELNLKTERLKHGLISKLFSKGESYKFQECVILPPKIKGLKRSEYKNKGKYPIYDQSQENISGYTDNENLLNNNNPAILFGDHTRILKYITEPFVLGADGTKVFWVKEGIDPLFFFYSLLNIKIPNTGYNRHFKYLKNSTILIPSLDEQKKIILKIKIFDEQITVNKKYEERLTRFKNGLAHDLLIGKVRII